MIPARTPTHSLPRAHPGTHMDPGSQLQPNTSSLGSTRGPHCPDKHGAGAARKVERTPRPNEAVTTCIQPSPPSRRRPPETSERAWEGPDGCHEWSLTRDRDSRPVHRTCAVLGDNLATDPVSPHHVATVSDERTTGWRHVLPPPPVAGRGPHTSLHDEQ